MTETLCGITRVFQQHPQQHRGNAEAEQQQNRPIVKQADQFTGKRRADGQTPLTPTDARARSPWLSVLPALASASVSGTSGEKRG